MCALGNEVDSATMPMPLLEAGGDVGSVGNGSQVVRESINLRIQLGKGKEFAKEIAVYVTSKASPRTPERTRMTASSNC